MWDTTLFNDGPLRVFLSKRESEVETEIQNYDAEQMLESDTDKLCEQFYEKYELKVPNLQGKEITIQSKEKDIYSRGHSGLFESSMPPKKIRGTEIAFFIPFEGDSELFNLTPSHFQTNPPSAEVTEDELRIAIEVLPDMEKSVVNEKFNEILSDINHWLEFVEIDIRAWNIKLKRKIRGGIEARKKKISRDKSIVKSIGFPIRKREDKFVAYAIPKVQKKIIPKSIRSQEGSQQGHELAMKNYESILDSINHMAIVLERSPKAFRTMEEEDLRFCFLIPLNGLYEGDAGGEVFNFNGKTDILIRSGGKNVFIAECKFWNGPKSLSDAINQLLGYVSWRDTKTAILIFNRNKEPSKVLAQIPDIVKKHPNYEKELEYNLETGFRFVLHQNEDKDRKLCLTVLVFDVPR